MKKVEKEDFLWKGIIEELFAAFLLFFFPDYVDEFDLEAKPVFLDKELAKLFPDKDGQKGRYVDKLVKVKLKNGGEKCLFLHVEIQGYPDEFFGSRMFEYFYRIYDRFGKAITALAIFTGKEKRLPENFEYNLLGTRLRYDYNVYKIWEQSEASLMAQSDNPFALVILAARYSLMTEREVTDEMRIQKHEWIYRKLNEMLSDQKKELVFAFIQNFVKFQDPENYRIFEGRIEQITGNKSVMGIRELLVAEGVQKGIQQGIQMGVQEEKVRQFESQKTLIKQVIAKGVFSYSEIAQLFKVDEALVEELAAMVKADMR